MKKGYKEPTRTAKLRVNIENALNEAETYSNMSRADVCKTMNLCSTTLWSRLRILRNEEKLNTKEVKNES